MEHLYLQLWIQERWAHSENLRGDPYKTEFLSMNSFSPLPLQQINE